jgi:arsenate reductase
MRSHSHCYSGQLVPTFCRYYSDVTVFPLHTMDSPPDDRFSLEKGRGLAPGLSAHISGLEVSLDQIDEPHRSAAKALAAWIASRYVPGQPLEIIVCCTGNSRRSVLASIMGNIGAAHTGLHDVRFHSSGTSPTAVNSRTIAALEALDGVTIKPTGDEATRGASGEANPRYRIRWGGEEWQEAEDFSKALGDPSLPKKDFGVIIVCSDADVGCPTVAGASVRIPMLFVDPKEHDGSAHEAEEYARTRDIIGRVVLASLLEARRLSEERGMM